ncbi:membrane dipeptidase [Litorilituus sediminis]|uniref:Membrane dipeptidase n=2 Tax=Litorilituus sediminis TaxID=718192 RepID=A0A4P6P9L8_9GAMM|nr:membrane dipeptidase [Litorilituus sediminis]
MKLKLGLVAFAISLTTACVSGNSVDKDAQLLAKAKRIHNNAIVLDTHHDFSLADFSEEQNYTMRLRSQVNLPKMDEGGLDVSWLIVYTSQGELNEQGYARAHKQALAKFDAIHRLTSEIAPDKIELALNSDDVRRIVKSGKKVAMIGVENGYPIGTDVGNVKKFYDLGARYMSIAHNGHSQLSDSNTGEKDRIWLHNGLSPLGREVIAEMNKWGMMIDISHPSKQANMQMMHLSKAPVIASHSASRALYDHSRNLSDEELLALKKNGGVVQAVAFRSYIDGDKSKAFSEAKKAIYQKYADQVGFEIISWDERKLWPEQELQAYRKAFNGIRDIAKVDIDKAAASIEQVTVSDFVDHIDYMVKLIGIDHVGISSDFDGGGGVQGWNDASETFNVTLELVKRGYSEADINKLWSGNLLRVLDEVQAVAKEIQANN